LPLRVGGIAAFLQTSGLMRSGKVAHMRCQQ
jgi:hypothetical protein